MPALNRDLRVAAILAVASACTVLAPSEDELYGGKQSTAPAGGGGDGTAGDGSDGAMGGHGGASSAGDAGASGAAGEATASGGIGGGGAGGAGAGGAGDGGTVDHGGGGGSAGAPVCAMDCGSNAECTATPSGDVCACIHGFVLDGAACRVPRSCSELHRYSPTLASGAYALQPAGAGTSFVAYCGMMLEGGGWTLAVNEGTSFDPTTMGVSDDLCYSSTCSNAGYSQVLLESDVMIDVSNSPITGGTYTVRVIVTGVQAMSRGKTLRTLFTTGPNYVDAEDNSNVAVRMTGGADCSTLPADWAGLVCSECATAGCKVPVMVFGDGDSDASCRTTPVPRFAIGGAYDYATAWSNCAGWPQDPNYAVTDFYPDYVRVWIR